MHEAWVKKIKEGDRDAFGKLYLRYYGSLCKFAWRFLNSPQLSEELVQDVFLNIWETRIQLDEDKSIRSYLYAIVRNKALNHIKHRKVIEKFNSDEDWLSNTTSFQMHDFDEQYEFTETVKKAIENLPKGAGQIYKLYRSDGLTYQEIAEVLEISPKTVESQMTRALKILRENLYTEYDKFLEDK
ncbi:MAG: RNA polymerase sigma-70 factor [Balneolales bacterium]